jgi:hypothetical protein
MQITVHAPTVLVVDNELHRAALRESELRAELSPYWRVSVVDVTGSTQADLAESVHSNSAIDGEVLIANYQSAGRGRLDREFIAAPLWPLFRHKPWQKILKDTWAKLEKGDYDWAHLAMNYWPERVREKCKTDKSLAIAHGLEHLYIEPPANARGRKGKVKEAAD